MDFETILGSKVLTSVDFNGLIVPANSLPGVIEKYCEPALFYSENMGEDFLTKSGSLFKIKYKRRYFAICSRHQVLGQFYDHENLVIHNHDSRRFLTAHRAIFAEGGDSEAEDFDALLYEYTDVVQQGRLKNIYWYDLTSEIGRDSIGETKLAFTIGYPGEFNSIDHETSHYHVVPRSVFGNPVKSRIAGRLAFKPIAPIRFEPAGMSGGPVFGLELDSDGYRARLVGILTNASKERFNFISINRMKWMFRNV